jgi:hypothetical protein
MALRLATIRAVGRNGHEAKVERSDIDWGIAIVEPAGNQLAEDARERTVHDEKSYGKRSNKVRDTIRAYTKANSGRAISRKELGRRVRYPSRDLTEILKTLCESGVIVESEGRPPSGGPLTKYYA